MTYYTGKLTQNNKRQHQKNPINSSPTTKNRTEIHKKSEQDQRTNTDNLTSEQTWTE